MPFLLIVPSHQTLNRARGSARCYGFHELSVVNHHGSKANICGVTQQPHRDDVWILRKRLNSSSPPSEFPLLRCQAKGTWVERSLLPEPPRCAGVRAELLPSVCFPNTCTLNVCSSIAVAVPPTPRLVERWMVSGHAHIRLGFRGHQRPGGALFNRDSVASGYCFDCLESLCGNDSFMVFIFIHPVCCFKFRGLKRRAVEPSQRKQALSLLARSEWTVVIYVRHAPDFWLWAWTTLADLHEQTLIYWLQICEESPNTLKCQWTAPACKRGHLDVLSEVCFHPHWLLHILQGSRGQYPWQLWLKGWRRKDKAELLPRPEHWSSEFRHGTCMRLCEPEAHPRCWSFATLLSWAFDPVRPRPNEGNVDTSSSAATVYVVLHDGQTFFFFIFPNFQWQRGEQCCASVFFIVQYCSALIPLFFHSILSQCQQSLKCQTKCDKDDDRGWEEGGRDGNHIVIIRSKANLFNNNGVQ